MKKTSNELYTSGDYFKKNPTFDEADSPWKARIISDILIRNNIIVNEVVEVGCGAGGVIENLATLHNEIQICKGFDISPQAIALAKKKETGRLTFYEEDFTLMTDVKTDLLLLVDVLEHIDDYYGMLRKLKEKSNYFILHVPLDLSCRTILKPHVMLQQRQAVGHIHYFTRDILQWALKDIGFTTIDWVYTKPITDTHPSKGLKSALKKRLRNMAFALNKNLTADLFGSYSMMILAK